MKENYKNFIKIMRLKDYEYLRERPLGSENSRKINFSLLRKSLYDFRLRYSNSIGECMSMREKYNIGS